jgi:hypothetical protein
MTSSFNPSSSAENPKKSNIVLKVKKETAVKRPRLMLVGSFNDLFLEALTELEFDFELNKSSKPTSTLEVDVVVIAADRTEQTLDYVKKYKAVPVINEVSMNFSEYNPLKETGNAFVYEKNSAWHMLAAVLRASETFKFSYDWKNLLEEVKDTAKYAKKNVF